MPSHIWTDSVLSSYSQVAKNTDPKSFNHLTRSILGMDVTRRQKAIGTQVTPIRPDLICLHLAWKTETLVRNQEALADECSRLQLLLPGYWVNEPPELLHGRRWRCHCLQLRQRLQLELPELLHGRRWSSHCLHLRELMQLLLPLLHPYLDPFSIDDQRRRCWWLAWARWLSVISHLLNCRSFHALLTKLQMTVV